MSKNNDRYKADFTHLDDESLEELDTESFERFHPKKKDAKKASNGKKKDRYEIDKSY